MTTTQKVLMVAMAVALVAALAANFYQATRVSELRGQAQALQDQQQPMAQQIQSLQQERDDAARRLG
jgi:cell division protein FtsL